MTHNPNFKGMLFSSRPSFDDILIL